MTRDEYRRQTVKARRWSKLWLWLGLLVSAPILLLVFLGDIFSFPFAARRNENIFRWSLFMIARTLAPAMIIGAGIGYFLAHRT